MNFAENKISIQAVMEASGVRFGTSGVRGLAEAMTEEVCFAYTMAFLKAIGLSPGSAVALGTDLRPSSPRIAAACAAAIRHAGYRVDYCGLLPTPALAYHALNKRVPAVMVTGSHIPFNRNGIKFYRETGEISKNDEARICAEIVNVPVHIDADDFAGTNAQAKQAYIDRYLNYFAPRCLAGMKLGFYEHSSVARDLLRELLELLGAQVVSLGRTNDFVPIDTEAVSQDDIERAQRWAFEYGFDAIISTDGDADRPLVGDENGKWLRGDILGILSAKYLGARAVVTTVSCNTAIDQCGAFSKVIRTRIGSPYVVEAMERLIASGEQGVVGFEPNGGFLVGDLLENGGRELSPLLTRDAVLPILCALSMAREKGGKVSGLTQDIPARFTASDRLQNFSTETSRAILQNLAASETAVNQLLAGLCGKMTGLDLTDGLRIFLENSEIVHFRPSGNAPELRCYVESSSEERSRALVRESLLRMKTESDSLEVH